MQPIRGLAISRTLNSGNGRSRQQGVQGQGWGFHHPGNKIPEYGGGDVCLKSDRTKTIMGPKLQHSQAGMQTHLPLLLTQLL